VIFDLLPRRVGDRGGRRVVADMSFYEGFRRLYRARGMCYAEIVVRTLEA